MTWTEILFGAIILIGIIEWLKTLDKESKLKRYYKYLPLLLASIPAVLIAIYNNTWNVGFIVLNWLSIFSFSTLGYQNIIKIVQKKFNTQL
jgi:hypothetical protein